MRTGEYGRIEAYMLRCMADAAHDKEHIYRVLYTALDIAQTEPEADLEILVAAALLHDIGREAQAKDSALCHAQVGSAMAHDFLLGLGWTPSRAAHARDSVLTHRFRTDRRPATVEAKILFDADKLDVMGAIGVARTLLYSGQIAQPLYLLGEDGQVLTAPDSPPSFFREYHYKLKGIGETLFTRRAKELAQGRQAVFDEYYEALLGEVTGCYERGESLLSQIL